MSFLSSLLRFGHEKRRPFNFGAGPATLPEPVLKRAAEEMKNWRGSGLSVMEMSHRSQEFAAILEQARSDLRELLNIPANYQILFLQGGAHLQFEMVPINLLHGRRRAHYVLSGFWGQRAAAAAASFCRVEIAASSEDAHFAYAPRVEDWHVTPHSAYVHYTANETINGVEYPEAPHWHSADIPLVCDMSSCLLSRFVDVARYGLIYAAAQKNIGTAGLTIVIVRDDLLGRGVPRPPAMLDYKTHADNGSLYNTPPTFAIYIAGLVFAWLKEQGGVAAIEQRNIAKAKALYEYLDASNFYRCLVRPEYRSRMNMPFMLPQDGLNAAFLAGAERRGLVQLRGHPLLGGMRASLYNAMPMAGVMALIDYLREFARKNKVKA